MTSRLKRYLTIVLLGIVGGGTLPALLYGITNRSVAYGMIVGVAISFTLTGMESAFKDRLRRQPFLRSLFIRTTAQITVVAFYVVTFLIGIRLVRDGLSPIDAVNTPEVRHFLFQGDLLFIIIYAITAIFLINMIRQMSRMLGQNVLMNMVLGKYTRPIEEQRIFMFLDLDASTTLAERLGNIRFHELIDDYIYDITPAIAETGGEIYQYVGDEIVVTWHSTPRNVGTECIECFFTICHTMDKLAPNYRKKYGVVPGFKAGFHYGTVIAGQIGDIKKEIVYQGDVVNTASRIKEKCHSLGARMLASRELVERINLDPERFQSERVGSFLLKGKEHEVELYGISEIIAEKKLTTVHA